jgi:mannose-6-phosphate isomerase-like protein (cupin superfamily)
MTGGVEVLSRREGRPLPILAGEGEALEVVGLHSGARHRTMCAIRLAPGAATVELRHPSEAVFYVEAGTGRAVGRDGGERLDLEPGAMVHVAPGTPYVLEAGEEPLELLGGPSPPDPALHGLPAGEAPPPGALRRFHRDSPTARMPAISSDARLVVWPAVGARTANMNYVRMRPGEENRPHAHPRSEDTIAILAGRGTVEDLSHGVTLPFEAGDVVHVPPGVHHRVRADRGVAVESVGGPCPPDEVMLGAAEPVAGS